MKFNEDILKEFHLEPDVIKEPLKTAPLSDIV